MILPSDYSRYVCKRAYVHMFVQYQCAQLIGVKCAQLIDVCVWCSVSVSVCLSLSLSLSLALSLSGD